MYAHETSNTFYISPMFNVLIPQQGEYKYTLKEISREKNLLYALGCEPTIFHLMSSCLGINFLTIYITLLIWDFQGGSGISIEDTRTRPIRLRTSCSSICYQCRGVKVLTLYEFPGAWQSGNPLENSELKRHHWKRFKTFSYLIHRRSEDVESL